MHIQDMANSMLFIRRSKLKVHNFIAQNKPMNIIVLHAFSVSINIINPSPSVRDYDYTNPITNAEPLCDPSLTTRLISEALRWDRKLLYANIL